MPPNITPPMVLRYGATDVPIIQLSLSSTTLPDTKLNDLGQNIIRPALAVVHGAEVPYPYGGKPRVIMADLDLARCRRAACRLPMSAMRCSARTSSCRPVT
jgi:multidrug efflux pump subunit AcrB